MGSKSTAETGSSVDDCRSDDALVELSTPALSVPLPEGSLSMYTRRNRCLPTFHSTSTISSPSERATLSAASRIFSKFTRRLPGQSRSKVHSNRRQQKSGLAPTHPFDQLQSEGLVYSVATAKARYALSIFGAGQEPAVVVCTAACGVLAHKPAPLSSRCLLLRRLLRRWLRWPGCRRCGRLCRCRSRTSRPTLDRIGLVVKPNDVLCDIDIRGCKHDRRVLCGRV